MVLKTQKLIRATISITKAQANLRNKSIAGVFTKDELIFKPCKNKEGVQIVDIILQIINLVKRLIIIFEA